MAYNKVILLGRLTADPELKQTKAGQSIVTPCIAINEGKDKVTFVNFIAFDQNAEFISRYFHKGDPIGIEGRVTSRKVESGDGKSRTELGIVCDRSFFVESARNEQGGVISPSDHPSATQAKNGAYMPSQYKTPTPPNNTSNANEEIPITDDDLPF